MSIEQKPNLHRVFIKEREEDSCLFSKNDILYITIPLSSSSSKNPFSFIKRHLSDFQFLKTFINSHHSSSNNSNSYTYGTNNKYNFSSTVETFSNQKATAVTAEKVTQMFKTFVRSASSFLKFKNFGKDNNNNNNNNNNSAKQVSQFTYSSSCPYSNVDKLDKEKRFNNNNNDDDDNCYNNYYYDSLQTYYQSFQDTKCSCQNCIKEIKDIENELKFIRFYQNMKTKMNLQNLPSKSPSPTQALPSPLFFLIIDKIQNIMILKAITTEESLNELKFWKKTNEYSIFQQPNRRYHFYVIFENNSISHNHQNSKMAKVMEKTRFKLLVSPLLSILSVDLFNSNTFANDKKKNYMKKRRRRQKKKGKKGKKIKQETLFVCLDCLEGLKTQKEIIYHTKVCFKRGF